MFEGVCFLLDINVVQVVQVVQVPYCCGIFLVRLSIVKNKELPQTCTTYTTCTETSQLLLAPPVPEVIIRDCSS